MQLLPEDPSGYSNRGYAWRKLGEYEAAVEDYTAAIRLAGSGSVRLHNNRAYCLAKLGRYSEAVQDYEAVLAADPANVHAYHNRWGGAGAGLLLGRQGVGVVWMASGRAWCVMPRAASWALVGTGYTSRHTTITLALPCPLPVSLDAFVAVCALGTGASPTTS